LERTFSDSIGKEFNQQPVHFMDPNYASKLEFALKLGYTEQQVQLVLGRLPMSPTQNELLEELIKVSTAPELFGTNSEADDLSYASKEATDIKNPKRCTLRHIVIDGSNVAMR
jgi:ribonuclease ZC3H12